MNKNHRENYARGVPDCVKGFKLKYKIVYSYILFGG